MIIMELDETETHRRVEHFLNEIQDTINTQNHPYKFESDKEICNILNYLFKLSGSKLRLNQFTGHDEPCFTLEPMDKHTPKTGLESYMYHIQFQNDVLKLPNVLKAFKRLYRFQYKYKHLWSDNGVD